MIEAKTILRPQNIVLTESQEKYLLVSFHVGKEEWTTQYFKHVDDNHSVVMTISSQKLREVGVEILDK